MTRVPQIEYAGAGEEARAAHDAHQRDRGRITNMKRTLLQSVPAFQALMEWYPLRDAVRLFLGDRLTTIFAHAVSSENGCLICDTFFRRILIDSGEDPDTLVLDDLEREVVAYGRALAHSPHRVPDEVWAPLAKRFTHEQLVALTAFGALMIATNVINNALEVPLDGYLEPYRRGATIPRSDARSDARSAGSP
jgi:alkylhydroperoxidase family enzyme